MSSAVWNPDAKSFKTIIELPEIVGAPKYAAWFWGKDDYLGRINLLTPTRVKTAAAQIQTGEMARADLPLHIWSNLLSAVRFSSMKSKHCAQDCGTQWDGFRHVADFKARYFYNFTKGSDIDGEKSERNEKASIHHWSAHGIAGRGVLLDYRSYATANGIKHDSATKHAISYEDLVATGKHQGLDMRPAAQGGDIQSGDILFVRSGYTEDYYKRSKEKNEALGLREFAAEGDDNVIEAWAGLKAEPAMRDWLHDCYFVASAGDLPMMEEFPPPHDGSLHGYLLA